MSNRLHPWSRRPDESAKAYGCFQMYLEAGAGRSVVGVASRCRKSVSLLWRWSARYGWVERADEYDAYAAAQEAKALIAREVQSRMRRARHGELIETAGTLALQKVAQEVQAGTRELSPREAADLVRTGAHVEHQALSQAPGVSVNVNVGQPAPPPVVSAETAMRAALAFIWEMHSDPAVQEVAAKAHNALGRGDVNVQEAN